MSFKKRLTSRFLTFIMVLALCCSVTMMIPDFRNMIYANAEGLYSSEVFIDVYNYIDDAELLNGKTLAPNQSIEKTWIESILAQENGVEFKLTVAQEDWDTWGDGFLWIEYNDFCDLRVFSVEGGITLWFQYWNNGEAINGYATYEGVTLAGTHTIKVTNVNLVGAAGSKQRMYVDGTMIGEQDFPYALKGYHLRIHNNTAANMILTSANEALTNPTYKEEVSQDIYDIVGNDGLISGVTLAQSQTVEKTWIESILAQENGVEFKLTVAQEDWDTWGDGFLWIEYNDFCDLRVFRVEGGITLWFQYWNNGEAINGYATYEGVTLAGTHTIKVTNVNLVGAAGSKQRMYVDGTMIGEQDFPYALKGYHLRIHNNTATNMVIASTHEIVEIEYNDEESQDIYELIGDVALINGKQLAPSQMIERTWIESVLVQENGVEFKLTVAQEDWDTWGDGFLWIEYNDFCDLRVFRAETGIALWFQYWNNGEAVNVFVNYEGVTLAGTHIIKITNVNASEAVGCKQRMYVDGVLVGEQEFPYALKGYHLRVHNNTATNMVIAAASEDIPLPTYNDEVCQDVYDLMGDLALLGGKTLAFGESASALWIESILAQENGIEFKLTISDWDEWASGDYVWINNNSYFDMYLMKSDNGFAVLGSLGTYAFPGKTLAGTHTIKFTCVSRVDEVGSRVRLYVDGEMLFEAYLTAALGGYHTVIQNMTEVTHKNIVVSSVKYNANSLTFSDSKNTDINTYNFTESYDNGIISSGLRAIDWNNMACTSAVDVVCVLDTTANRWDNEMDGYVSFNFGNVEVVIYKNYAANNDKPFVKIYDWSGTVPHQEFYLTENFDGKVDLHISLVDIRLNGVFYGVKVIVDIDGQIVECAMKRGYAEGEGYFFISNKTSEDLQFSSNYDLYISMYEKEFAAYEAEHYSVENWAEIALIIDHAIAEMENATLVSDIINIGDGALVQISSIWTLEKEAEFENVKLNAKSEAVSYAEQNEYYEEEQTRINGILEVFNADIDSSDDFEIVRILLDNVKIAIDAVPTKIEMDKINENRESAKTALNTVVSAYSQDDYSDINWQAILAIKAKYEALIENTVDEDELAAMSALAESEMDLIATKAEEALSKAKTDAIITLENYADKSQYSAANVGVINGYIIEYTEKINNAEEIADVESLLVEVKGKIDIVEKISNGSTSESSVTAPVSGGCGAGIAVQMPILAMLGVVAFVRKKKED